MLLTSVVVSGTTEVVLASVSDQPECRGSTAITETLTIVAEQQQRQQVPAQLASELTWRCCSCWSSLSCRLITSNLVAGVLDTY